MCGLNRLSGASHFEHRTTHWTGTKRHVLALNKYVLLHDWVCDSLTYWELSEGLCASQFSSAQLLSLVWLFATPWTAAPRLPVHHLLPEFTQTDVHWVGDAIQPSHPVLPFSSCPQSFPASGSFPMSQFFVSGGQSIGVSDSTSVFPKNIQDLSPLGWTGWIYLHPRDSQESSPTPQFKSISSSVLSLLYSPTLTSIHDYWKNHSLD